jgi:uncharacterized protein (TIGR00730 family)
MKREKQAQPTAPREAWKLFGIMAEFFEATERLTDIEPAVSAFVVLPGGFGTLDELFEALTLVQTGKTRQMPIILVHEPYWRGLIEWCRERVAGEGMIDAKDLDLLQVCNEPRQVVDAIFAFYEKRGFEPSPAERESMLNL